MPKFFKCISKAIIEEGFDKLIEDHLENHPNIKFICNVAKNTWSKYQDKDENQEQSMRAEFSQMLANSEQENQRQITEAVEQSLTTSKDQAILTIYLNQIPLILKQTQKRPADPSGKTLAENFSLRNNEDLAKLLPTTLPRFLPNSPVPNRSDWILERFLGSGGFGEVWLARNTMLKNKQRAIKFCLQGDLLRETCFSDASQHPYIVSILDTDLQSDIPYLMYQYIEGGTLIDCLYQWASLPIEAREQKVRDALITLSDIVGYCHNYHPQIVHRDLKPANILVNKEGQLFITDFGMAGLAPNQQLNTQMVSRFGQLQSMLYGAHTPLYSPPQQQRGETATPQDDIYALGVIGYQLLTSQVYCGAGSDMAEELEELGVSNELMMHLKKCTANKPERRYANGMALNKALLTSIQEEGLKDLIHWADEQDISGIKLPRNIQQLKELTRLDLRGCGLTELPESMGQLSQLTSLFIDNNQLTKLPESIGQLSQLTRLYLDNNQLTKLPESIWQLSQLTGLGLYNNQLTKLPESIWKLSQLTGLGLGNNQLTKLPESIWKLSQLTGLYLYNNQLTKLPESIGQLINLKILRIENNPLIQLPQSIEKLINLDNKSKEQFTQIKKTLTKKCVNPPSSEGG